MPHSVFGMGGGVMVQKNPLYERDKMRFHAAEIYTLCSIYVNNASLICSTNVEPEKANTHYIDIYLEMRYNCCTL